MTRFWDMLKVLCGARAQAIAELGMAAKAQHLMTVKQVGDGLCWDCFHAVAWWLHSNLLSNSANTESVSNPLLTAGAHQCS